MDYLITPPKLPNDDEKSTWGHVFPIENGKFPGGHIFRG